MLQLKEKIKKIETNKEKTRTKKREIGNKKTK